MTARAIRSGANLAVWRRRPAARRLDNLRTRAHICLLLQWAFLFGDRRLLLEEGGRPAVTAGAVPWWLAIAHGFSAERGASAAPALPRGRCSTAHRGPPGDGSAAGPPAQSFLPAANHAGDYRRTRSRNGPRTVGTGTARAARRKRQCLVCTARPGSLPKEPAIGAGPRQGRPGKPRRRPGCGAHPQ